MNAIFLLQKLSLLLTRSVDLLLALLESLFRKQTKINMASFLTSTATSSALDKLPEEEKRRVAGTVNLPSSFTTLVRNKFDTCDSDRSFLIKKYYGACCNLSREKILFQTRSSAVLMESRSHSDVPAMIQMRAMVAQCHTNFLQPFSPFLSSFIPFTDMNKLIYILRLNS